MSKDVLRTVDETSLTEVVVVNVKTIKIVEVCMRLILTRDKDPATSTPLMTTAPEPREESVMFLPEPLSRRRWPASHRTRGLRTQDKCVVLVRSTGGI